VAVVVGAGVVLGDAVLVGAGAAVVLGAGDAVVLGDGDTVAVGVGNPEGGRVIAVVAEGVAEGVDVGAAVVVAEGVVVGEGAAVVVAEGVAEGVDVGAAVVVARGVVVGAAVVVPEGAPVVVALGVADGLGLGDVSGDGPGPRLAVVGVGAGEPFGVVVGAGEVVADGGLQMPARGALKGHESRLGLGWVVWGHPSIHAESSLLPTWLDPSLEYKALAQIIRAWLE
jgi:hypothetical protein